MPHVVAFPVSLSSSAAAAAATGLINCISGLLAYPTLAIGVNVMYYFLRKHHKKLTSIKTKNSKKYVPFHSSVSCVERPVCPRARSPE